MHQPKRGSWHRLSPVALLSVAACGHDWEAFDPSLAGGAEAGGATSSSSGLSGAGATGVGGASASSGGSAGSGASASSSGSASSAGGAGGAGLTYRDVVLSDGPVGYWRLGEAAAQSAADEVQPGHVGTYVGTVQVGVPGAIVGDADTAARFNALADQVVFGDVFDFAGQAPFSVEAWVDPDGSQFDFPCCAMMVSKQSGPRIGWELGLKGDPYLGLLDRELETLTEEANYALPTGGFAHLVGTFDGAMIRVYVDGVLGAEAPSTLLLPDHNAPLRIGGSDEQEPFAGAIDEVAIYDKALSAERILAHFQAGSM